PEGVAPADLPGQLRGGGGAGAAGGPELRGLPAGAGGEGGGGAGPLAGCEAPAAWGASGEERVAARLAPAGDRAREAACRGGGGGGDVGGPAGERVSLRECRHGEDTPPGRNRPGAGAVGPQGAVHDL